MPFPRTVLLLAASLAASLVLAGCVDEAPSDTSSDGSGQSPPRAEVSGDPDTWPLTGLTVEKGSSVRKHPVLVLKLDNTAASAPQQGLGSADLVVEELVEGGMTRLAAFYYATIPGDVGPVRSMRASDIGIVAPVDGDMVTSGAAEPTIERIRAAGIDFHAEGSAGFFRESSRSAPYNLFTNLDDVAKAARGTPARPVDYLPFGSEDDLPAGRPAATLSATFSGGHTTSWTYRDGGYVNDDTFAAAGDEFPADSVLVLRVRVGDAGYRDPAGNPVPETQLEGTGEALLFHGGRLVRGQWRKDGLEGVIRLSAKGAELAVPAGHTWIELVPVDGGDVAFE